MQPIALTIAGSDPSGGAGIQADLKTFHQFGVYGEAVITLITVQNTVRVSRVEVMQPALVLEQLAAVLEDIPPGAAKTGALGSAEMVEAVARAAADFAFPLVVDPVMVSKHGLSLLPDAAVAAIRELLLPRAFLITPNVPEAEALTGMKILTLQDDAPRRLPPSGTGRAGRAHQRRTPGRRLHRSAVRRRRSCTNSPRRVSPRRIPTAPVAPTPPPSLLYSRGGLPLVDAVARAKWYIHEAICTNPGLGHGSGPVNHHAEVQ